MLKIFRDNLKYLSWILWLVVIIFIAFVFVDFGGGLSGGPGPRAAAATVGDRTVSYRDFEREYRRLETQYRQAFGGQLTPEMIDQMKLPLMALERLVDQELLLEEADRIGLSASDLEVRQAILEIPGLKDPQGRFVGKETYDRFLRVNGLGHREFEKTVRDELVLAKLQTIVASSVRIGDAEVEKAYRRQAERAAIRYFQIPSSRFAAEAQNVTPAELESHFAAHREEFRLPDQRVVDYLLVDTIKTRAQLTFEPAELEAYYRDNLADYQQEEQVRARHILLRVDDERSAEAAAAELERVRARVEAGEEFATLAGQISEDPGSKGRGGDLGYFRRGSMLPEFEEAAFGAEPNALLGPLRTTLGYHLIQVLDHRAGGQRPFSEVEAQVRARLAADRADTIAQARAEELARRIENEQLSTEEQWRALADGDVVTFATTAPFGPDDVVPGIGRKTPFASAAFSLAAGDASTPVKTPRGFAILRLKEELPARLPELAEVEAKVRAAVVRQRMTDAALAAGERAKRELQAGKALEAVAAELGAEVADSGEFAASGNIQGLGTHPEIAAAALALEPGQFGGPVKTPTGAVVFEVVSRQRFDPQAFAGERDLTRANLERTEVNRLLGSILDQRKRELKVNYDRPLLEQFGLLEGSAS